MTSRSRLTCDRIYVFLRETLFFGKRKGFLALFLKEIEMGIGCSIGMSGGSKCQRAQPAFGKRKRVLALSEKETGKEERILFYCVVFALRKAMQAMDYSAAAAKKRRQQMSVGTARLWKKKGPSRALPKETILYETNLCEKPLSSGERGVSHALPQRSRMIWAIFYLRSPERNPLGRKSFLLFCVFAL